MHMGQRKMNVLVKKVDNLLSLRQEDTVFKLGEVSSNYHSKLETSRKLSTTNSLIYVECYFR